jgi:dipeptidyl-peptidase-4
MKEIKLIFDVHRQLNFFEDNSFIWLIEKDGFNHIYLYDKTGKLKIRLPVGNGK